MMPKSASTRGMISRRDILAGSVAAGAFMLLGCAPPASDTSTDANAGGASGGAAAKAGQAARMIVYKDPSCGCCGKWAEMARQAGYAVEVEESADMAGLKRQLGVPDQLWSCHTAQVNGFAIEGHVPFDAVAKLVQEGAEGVKGIAVPGMPAGSPGMEMPDGRTDPFQVIAFLSDGGMRVF